MAPKPAGNVVSEHLLVALQAFLAQSFSSYGQDLQSRVKVWQAAVSASEQMAEEFATWLRQPQMSKVQDL